MADGWDRTCANIITAEMQRELYLLLIHLAKDKAVLIHPSLLPSLPLLCDGQSKASQ